MSTTRNVVSKEMVSKISSIANVSKNVTKSDINEICNSLFEVLIESLKEKDSVMLNNTMKIKKTWRKERVYKNPKTGAESTKDAHYAVTISAMPGLKKRIESFTDEDIDEGKVVDDEKSDTDHNDEESEVKNSDTEDDEPVMQKAVKKTAPKKKVVAKKKVVVEDDNSDDDKPVKTTRKKVLLSDSESDSDSDE